MWNSGSSDHQNLRLGRSAARAGGRLFRQEKREIALGIDHLTRDRERELKRSDEGDDLRMAFEISSIVVLRGRAYHGFGAVSSTLHGLT